MSFLVTVLIYIGSTMLYEVLRPRPKITPNSLGDFSFPTIGQGRPLPKLWGTAKIEGGVVGWYGDLSSQPIYGPGGFWIFSPPPEIGVRYFLGIQLILCSGQLDEVLGIYVDDRLVEPDMVTVTAHRTEFTLNQPSFLGGGTKGGGVVGDFFVYHGTPTQLADDYFEAQIGKDLPAWRNWAYLMVRGAHVVANSSVVPQIAVVARSTPNQLGLTGGAENIDGDANPAAMIFDLLTSAQGKNGLGGAPGLIDTVALRAAGQTLQTEGMGLSMLVTSRTTARELLLDIFAHIDAVGYVDPRSGLFKVELVRPGYDPGTLPALDESNCTVRSFSRPAWSETRNWLTATFISREENFSRGQVQHIEQASVHAQAGRVYRKEASLEGFSNAANAQQALGRLARALSYPLATMEIVADRTAWDFRPGTPFVLDWPPLGISGMVCRVMEMRPGTLTDGKIVIDAAEDVFGLDHTGYTPPPDTAWEDPVGDAPALTDSATTGAPYPAVEGLSTGEARGVVMASRGLDTVTLGYEVQAKVGGNFGPSTEINVFTPSGLLEADIGEDAVQLGVLDGPDTEFIESVSQSDFARGVNVAWIQTAGGADEFIAFQTVTVGVGKITLSGLARGCIDTVPRAFAAGTRVWFISYGSGGPIGVETPSPPAIAATAEVRFMPFNNQYSADSGLSAVKSFTSTRPERSELPYPATQVKFNTLNYPDEISGELTVSWEHRNRLDTWSYAASGYTNLPEDGVTYTVKVWGELGTLVHTETGITSNTWTYDEATEIAESGLGRLNDHLEVEVITIRGVDQGRFSVVWEFDRV
jgi:hypothetical protein